MGLTGGTGSGKSTVAARLSALGATVVDADRLAREVVAPGTVGLDRVVAEFGRDVVGPDGALDRPALARIVFADDDRRRVLEEITHPLIAARTAELAAMVPADGVLVHDVPLLVEKRMGAGYHVVVVVHADADERVRRLAGRGMHADDARSRVRAQASDDERRAAADVWLDNDGTTEQLLGRVDELWSSRLAPFAANLSAGRPAVRPTQAVLVDPDPAWAAAGQRLAGRVARAAGDRARRVEHIGSTSVPGLAAKDCIDLQVVVADLATAGEVAADLCAAGLVRREGRWWDGASDDGLDKAMAQNADPGQTVNCHVRTADSPAWRDDLLFRDWLRATPSAVVEYAALKRRLASQPHETIQDYADRKTPWVRAALDRAGSWARETGWSPPRSLSCPSLSGTLRRRHADTTGATCQRRDRRRRNVPLEPGELRGHARRPAHSAGRGLRRPQVPARPSATTWPDPTVAACNRHRTPMQSEPPSCSDSA